MRSKSDPKKTKPARLKRSGLPRFSWYVLSAPQADVKSALERSFRVLRNAVNRLHSNGKTICRSGCARHGGQSPPYALSTVGWIKREARIHHVERWIRHDVPLSTLRNRSYHEFNLSSNSRIFIGSSARRIFCVSPAISGRLVVSTRCLMLGTCAENIENWRSPKPSSKRV